MATIVLLYGAGVFIVAQAAGVFFEYRNEQARLKKIGEWIWNMRDHVVVINTPSHNRGRFINRLVEELATARQALQEQADRDTAAAAENYLLITEGFPNGLPQSLESSGVRLKAGRGDEPGVLRDANIDQAAGVVILATDPLELEFSHDDSVIFDTIHRVREAGYTGYLVAEVVDPRNRQRMADAGADAVVMPVRAFPGLIARALFHPGMEEVIETLFDSKGNQCIAVTARIEGETWRDVVERFVRNSQGTPIGYALAGEVVTEPSLGSVVTADTVYLITGSA